MLVPFGLIIVCLVLVSKYQILSPLNHKVKWNLLQDLIYIVDRKKDMIISGGENIYSAEVEAALITHPKIREAAVIGVPDPKWGEAVKAFVGLESGQSATAEEIITYCGKNLARFKLPKSVEFVSALPRSATGKILKRDLRVSKEC